MIQTIQQKIHYQFPSQTSQFCILTPFTPLRPTSENIQYMCCQLASHKFGEYHLFFSNIMNDCHIHLLVDSDEQEVLQQVQEFYADFVAIDH